MWKIPDQDLEALISEFERSSWREMRLRLRGVELILAKDAVPVFREISGPASTAPEAAAAAEQASPPAAPDNGPEQAESVVPAGWAAIRTPTLGTFYRSPKPGTPPFVGVGHEVKPDTEVCLVEVMKLFTTVRAGITGIIREIYPRDGELVEFKQALFLVEPRG